MLLLSNIYVVGGDMAYVTIILIDTKLHNNDVAQNEITPRIDANASFLRVGFQVLTPDTDEKLIKFFYSVSNFIY